MALGSLTWALAGTRQEAGVGGHIIIGQNRFSPLHGHVGRRRSCCGRTAATIQLIACTATECSSPGCLQLHGSNASPSEHLLLHSAETPQQGWL